MKYYLAPPVVGPMPKGERFRHYIRSSDGEKIGRYFRHPKLKLEWLTFDNGKRYILRGAR